MIPDFPDSAIRQFIGIAAILFFLLTLYISFRSFPKYPPSVTPEEIDKATKERLANEARRDVHKV